MLQEKVSLEEIHSLAEKSPLILDIDPLSILYLPSDIIVLEDEEKLLKMVDSPEITLPSKIIIRDVKIQKYPKLRYRLPYFKVIHDPLGPDLNKIIIKKFTELKRLLKLQSNVKDNITKEVRVTNPQIVILYIVDGLSYHDFKTYGNINFLKKWKYTVDPLLVDCPTLTQWGMKNIIGIGARALPILLHELGYKTKIGFTYWEKEKNQLTKDLFIGFNSENIYTFVQFSELEKTLTEIIKNTSNTRRRVYIQIIRSGFDELAHHVKINIERDKIMEVILKEFAEIIKLIENFELSANIYLTADHGILWKENLKDAIVLNIGSGNENPRYLRSYPIVLENCEYVSFFMENGEIFCLGYPYLKRPLKPLENGTHGGISYQESIVPFISVYI